MLIDIQKIKDRQNKQNNKNKRMQLKLNNGRAEI